MKKKVSLILTTFNCKNDFLKTIKSIELQDYPNIEVCIADGCSTDGTLLEIEKYRIESKHKVVYKSEKDTGIYDGINHAIAMATGDYIEVMNDEYTCREAVSILVAAIENSHLTDCVGAHADLVYMENGKVRRRWKMGNGSIYKGWMPAHPSLMLKRDVYEKYGVYNTSYTCSADYEFMLRFLKDKKKLDYVPKTLISMYYGGTSTSTATSYLVSIKEAMKALKENHISCGIIITTMRFFRVLLQFRS